LKIGLCRPVVALIPACLVFILGGVYAGWLVYGSLTPPYLSGPLPLPAALYGVLIWPFIWGLTEQMTYNGYLLPRLQVLWRSTGLAVAIVAFVWSLQHSFMPLTFDPRFMAFRLLSPVPESIFVTFLSVSATSPVDSVGDFACPDGWCHRPDRRASPAVEGMRHDGAMDRRQFRPHAFLLHGGTS
jgi:hypothetical protein